MQNRRLRLWVTGDPPSLLRLGGLSPAVLLAAASPVVVAQETIPPPVTITQSDSQVAAGMIFLTPSPPRTLHPNEVASIGPEIVDNQGRPVWFRPLPVGLISSDLRLQTYMGSTVLTWAEGVGFQVANPSTPTTDYICDTSYNVVATVRAGN